MSLEIERLRIIAGVASDPQLGLVREGILRPYEIELWWWIGGAKRTAEQPIPFHRNPEADTTPRYLRDLHAADALFQARSSLLRAGSYRVDYDHGLSMMPLVRVRLSVSGDSFARARGPGNGSNFDAFGADAPSALVSALCRCEVANREGQLAAQAHSQRGSH